MRRQLRPSIDGLENKTLLSNLGAGLVAHRHVLPAEVQRAAPVPALAVSLTTNQTTYQPGQVVQMSLTMTNTTNHNERVPLGPSRDGFFITHNGKVIWRSNAGLEPQFVVIDVLKPGQSVTLTARWTLPASVTGSFVVHDQMFPSGPVAAFNVTSTPTPPTPILPISPTPNFPTRNLPTPTPTPPTPILPILPIPTPPAPISPIPTPRV